VTRRLELVVWNMAHRSVYWEALRGDTVALLSEAAAPPVGHSEHLLITGDWRTAGDKRRPWSTAIASPADAPIESLDFVPSRAGTLTAAMYDSSVILASCYATWEPDPARPEWRTGRSDVSAMALVDDLRRLHETHQLPILAAGDWNLWPSNYPNPGGCSVIIPVEEALAEIGIARIPLSGTLISDELRASTYGLLPADTVPTYDPRRRGTPRYEVDHVFASTVLTVSAAAINTPADWGPSDHCQIRVELTYEPASA